MKKTDTLELSIHTAFEDIKSFSPGEVYEFLQNKFPLYPIKSKAHAKSANTVISSLRELDESGSLQKSEITQVRLFVKVLSRFVDEFEATNAEIEVTDSPKKKTGIADELLKSLKEAVEIEKSRFFGREKEKDFVEASFKKIKRA